MSTLRVGSALIDRVEEHQLPVSLAALTRDEELIARRIKPLPSGFFDPMRGTFQFCNHSWVLRVDGLTVLIDPCTGNGRKGRGPYFDDLDSPYLERLSILGTPAETIDVVFCTHLHHDHCGWNTVQKAGEWAPTFPRATYLFAADEYRRWDTASADQHPNTFNPNVFDECVRPVVEAGQAQLISLPYQVSEGLTVEAAPGHTVGHALLRLTSSGETAYFSGDVFHHPVQMTRPEAHLPGCDDLATAIKTRELLVQRILDDDALVFPAHFSAPHYGRLARDGDEVAFVPGAAADAREVVS